MKHICHPKLLQQTIRVLVVGAGGTGSFLTTDLVRLQIALEELGHPGGMQIMIADGDTVSDANVGRQTFYMSDVGFNKAEVVVNRINACYGLNWTAHPGYITEDTKLNTDIVISCVDSAKARRMIQASFKQLKPLYWLDMGNKTHNGQCVLGEPITSANANWKDRLPTVTELYPSLLDESLAEDDTPSCSLAEALEKQGLFINRAMAMYGLQILEHLIRNGGLDYHAVFTDVRRCKTTTLPVCPQSWQQMGYVNRSRRKIRTR